MLDGTGVPVIVMTANVDDSAQIVDSTIGQTEIREYVTVHDSEIGDGCQIYERASIKKSSIAGPADINAGAYVENAEIGANVQLGPNCSVVGVSHELNKQGMTFRNDVFNRIILHEGVFVGANAVVSPGVEIGENSVVGAGTVVTEDIGRNKIVLGTPPSQRVVDSHEWTIQ